MWILMMLSYIPTVAVFQVVLIPVFFPQIIGTPASWLFSIVFSALWNLMLIIVIKIGKLTGVLIMLNLVPTLVFFQVVLVPVFVPHLIGTPASWLFSMVFSALWNLMFFIVIKLRARGVTKGTTG